MRKPTYQFFSLEEYEQRLKALRSRMEQKGVDVMLINTPENLYYMTGYQTPGYYWYQTLIVPLDQEPVIITRLNESSNVEPLTWVEDSRPYEDTDDWIEKTRDALASLGLIDKTIGIEHKSWFITIDDYQRLKVMLSDADFVDCSGLVEQGRVIKSPQEIEYIRHASRAAVAGMKAGIEAAVVGATENEVAAEVHKAQILEGSEYTGLPLFVAAGTRSLMEHATWYRKPIAPNEVVAMEIPGCINRYHSAFFRTVCLGEPPETAQRVMEAVTDSLQKAKSFIKPGVKAGDVFEVVREHVESANVGYKMDRRAAYSIGIAFAPDWGEGHILSFFRGDQRILRAGMTFHLIGAGVRIPGVGKVECTDSILITPGGCETLTDGMERKLFVK